MNDNYENNDFDTRAAEAQLKGRGLRTFDEASSAHVRIHVGQEGRTAAGLFPFVLRVSGTAKSRAAWTAASTPRAWDR